MTHIAYTNTYLEFHTNDQWRVVTGGTERLEVSNSGIKLSSSGSTACLNPPRAGGRTGAPPHGLPRGLAAS